MVQGKINRGKHTDHQARCHSIWTKQWPLPPSPIFYRPDALPAAQPTVSKHWKQLSIWIREKMLEFSLTVLPAPSPYLNSTASKMDTVSTSVLKMQKIDGCVVRVGCLCIRALRASTQGICIGVYVTAWTDHYVVLLLSSVTWWIASLQITGGHSSEWTLNAASVVVYSLMFKMLSSHQDWHSWTGVATRTCYLGNSFLPGCKSVYNCAAKWCKHLICSTYWVAVNAFPMRGCLVTLKKLHTHSSSPNWFQ